jgi:hypothetical protein
MFKPVIDIALTSKARLVVTALPESLRMQNYNVPFNFPCRK